MKPTLRKFLGLSILMGGLALSAAAQPGHPHGPSAELRKQEREYVQAKVLPVLRQQRQKLEQELAPTDRTQLVTYRTQLKALEQRQQALHEAARAQAQPAAPDNAERRYSHPAPSPEMLAAYTEQREIRQQVARLVQKYQANITRLAEEIKPQQTQWATDIQALVAKSRPAGAPEQPERFHGFRFGHWHHLMRASAFLLMEPGAAEPATDVSLGTSLYPNPVVATTQLQYEVKAAGPVTVALLDKNGNTLRTAVQLAHQEKGNYTQALDLSELASGTYFYKVTTGTGTETKRFVKE